MDNMTERPNCQMKNCTEGAVIMFGTKMVCGKCCIKLQQKMQEIENRKIEAAMEEINGAVPE